MNVISPDKDKDNPIRFAGSELGADCHICGFFRNPEEEYHLLLPFIKEGFERGEKAFHIVDPKLLDDHLRRLNSAGINVTEAEKSGQLELCNWTQVYLPDGYFDESNARPMAGRAHGGRAARFFPHPPGMPHGVGAGGSRRGE
jgi:hypothetical protein